MSFLPRISDPACFLIRAARLLLTGAAILVVLAAPVARASSGTVNVFYAGSLVNLNEQLMGPAFAAATGYTYQGQSAGSLAIANEIKGKITTPDVVEFVNPAVNSTLMGSVNGSYVSWYLTFAHSSLVIGYDPKSKYAKAYRDVQAGKRPYYAALEQSGLRFGRTDPNTDPKGQYALFFARLTQKEYHAKHFEKKVLGPVENTREVFPEEVLIARLLTGQIDAGIFYLSEVKALGIPYITLPGKVNYGNAKDAKLYATQHYTTSAGQTVVGAPIEYTVTIPSTVKNQTGAVAFVRFLLSSRVRAISSAHGLLPVKVTVGGERRAVPGALTRFIGQK